MALIPGTQIFSGSSRDKNPFSAVLQAPTRKTYSLTLARKLIIWFFVAVAIAGPVVLALHQARSVSLQAEMDKVTSYALDVQNRADMTTDQTDAGIRSLAQSKATDPCSASQIKLMRQIDLSSSYIQAIGHVEGETMICSSIWGNRESFNLGPVDFTSKRGIKFRTNVNFPFDPASKYAVIERDGYAAIIHKQLPIDATTQEKDVSLATMWLDYGQVYASKGTIKPEWIKALNGKKSIQLVDDGYVVAIVRSPKYRAASLAALPKTYINQRINELTLFLLPVGLVCGLLLAIAVFYLIRSQSSMQAFLKAGLSRNEFFMHYQPIVDLTTRKCVGAEALLRWERANGEPMRPEIFIPVAEESALIHSITERVAKLVGKDAQKVFAEHPDFHLAVNVSAADFYAEDILQILHSLKEATAAGAGNLMVEATERCLMDASAAKSVITQIRAAGVQIALDDFGTGYSSLSYLDAFQIDYIKIDKSFVDKIGIDAPTSYVVAHIIEMAKSMGMKMIAEGVETEEQATYLREHGVHYAQGWLFGMPMPFEEFLKLATTR
ncbi:MAG TPA: EAL domain-containing protein [Methylophilaceae bacterium]|nr:EAL domain-containing protein [Methylophilaceae bacterium]